MGYKEAEKIATELIMTFEGFKSKPYLCPAKVWTIGFGRTEGVDENTEKTTKEAEKDWVAERVAKDMTWLIRDCLPNTWLRTTQWAALASLVYNIGRSAFKNSTLCKLLSQGKALQEKEVTSSWLAWKFSKGIVLQGLTNRRKAEVALFFKAP